MVHVPYFHDFTVPAGIITYPLTFLLSDLVTELFGPRKAKLMVYIAFGMNLLSFGIIQLAMMLPASTIEQDEFRAVLGLSGLRIFSSLAAYVVAQVVAIQFYAWMKQWTDARFLWLRNNGAAVVSQILDTVIVDMIYLYGGLGMTLMEMSPIIAVSYIYKILFSVVATPLFYLAVFLLKKDWFFGEQRHC